MSEKRGPAGAGDRQKSSFASAAPLPRGGGAIRGIGEKVSANPVNGTAAMTVPLAVSEGRGGFSPELTLSYDSGAGNGPFGFGWSLSLPAVTRKTDGGLPRYLDREEPESDTFLLSGSDDLVPLLRPDGTRDFDDTSAPGFVIHPYRPRVEGLFARVERWTATATGETHWRSIGRDNVTSLYGTTAASRVADPADPSRVFSWLVAQMFDRKGNAIVYEYAAEDGARVDLSPAHERNRVRTAQRYLKRVRYGNRAPNRDANWNATDAAALTAWCFEVLFDYDEDHVAAVDDRHVIASSSGSAPWSVRPDPFSSYRAGFELRTYRRCRRVLMFHHFADLGCEPVLVRATELEYDDLADPATVDDELAHQGSTRFGSFLRRVTQSGFVRDAGAPPVPRNGTNYDTYLRAALPPLELEYTRPVVHDEIRELDDESLENLPEGIDDDAYQWVDLDGEGLSGVLAARDDAWLYKPNLGNGRFGAVQVVATKPSSSRASQRLLDLDGNGRLDVVSFTDAAPGFFERTPDGGWETFRAFESLPAIDFDQPNLRFIDLDGDGHADVLVTEEEVFTWYPSLEAKGFAAPRRVRTAPGDDSGPRLVFADGTESLYLAGMCGDGLTALVRIRNGEVCYWPNLGYGRFGAKVTMDNAPWFDDPAHFEQRRIRLADVDGSGVDDILYLGRDGVRLYFNQSGNRCSDARPLPPFPSASTGTIMTADLLGNGTTCLVWSSPVPGSSRRPLRYVDLMGGRKPHLLTRSANHLGAETRIDYAASTKFYLDDRRAGRPWITRVPFPVHVVERIETRDLVGDRRFVARYAYHHGYFDGEEREFRGFGLVEQWDSEESPAGAHDVPPVLTKSWFHTGAYAGRDRIATLMAAGYYNEPDAFLAADTILPPGLTAEEEREACRALKGSLLRREIFALDGSASEAHPYSVTEQSFDVVRLQPRGGNEHAVFFTHPREAIRHHYERDAGDPRVEQTFTLGVNAYGDVLREVTVAYGRRQPSAHPALTPADHALQARPIVTSTERTFTDAILAGRDHLGPLLAEESRYDLTGFTPAVPPRFGFDDWSAPAATIPFEQAPQANVRERRLVARTRTLHRKGDLTAFHALGDADPLVVASESYHLALTPGRVADLYVRREQGQPDEPLLPAPAAILESKGADGGGYVAMDGAWWARSGRTFFDETADVANPAATAAQELAEARAHFFVARKATDAFDRSTVVTLDADDLFTIASIDAAGNVTGTEYDYRVLQPRLITDPNGNRRAASFDALGLAVATAVMGKQGENAGDELDVDPDPPLATIQAFAAAPHLHAAALLGKATTRIVYDVGRHHRTGQPAFSATLVRERHFHDGGPPRIQISFAYSDGFGREVQQKTQAEAGDAPQRAPQIALPGGDVAPGAILPGVAHAPQRWVGSGRTIFNNKGKPVRQYEPFFSTTHLHEPESEVAQTGVGKVLFYDPPGRVVATLHPHHAYEKLVIGPWQQARWDGNDTVLLDPATDPDVAGYVGAFLQSLPAPWETWHQQRANGQLGAAEAAAAARASAHAGTPSVSHCDPLGRPFLTFDPFATRVELDLDGNQLAIRDDGGRLVVRHEHDLIGTRIQVATMDGGTRWLLHDAAGNRIRTWGSREFDRRLAYDALRRATDVFVVHNGTERLAERTVWGEPEGSAANHRTRVHRRFDAAGVVTHAAYDFKGNLLETRRELLPGYAQEVDWQSGPAVNGGTFTTSSTYDALDRVASTTTPDGSVQRPAYNEANLLQSIDAEVRGAVPAVTFVADVDYDARGQRARIEYGNGAVTTYTYDPLTFRLVVLKTTRPNDPDATASQLFGSVATIQDLRYTYDAVGNITRIEDAALKTVFHDGQQVGPVSDFTYDAAYRLVKAEGREHAAQTAHAFPPNRRDHPFAGHTVQPLDLQALRRYTEEYEYDGAGNFERIRHVASGGNWTRTYDYEEPSALEPAKHGNRLTRTTVGNGFNHIETYGHDAHGNMTSMPHLPSMEWDHRDQLRRADLGGGGTAWYVYDADGRRIRKVIESQNGTRRKERLWLGDFELYREYDAGGNSVVHERETLQLRDGQHRFALVETLTIDAGNPVANPVPLQRLQLGNHLGSSSLELDGDAALIAYEEYHPYGTTAFQAGRGAAEVQSRRYRFGGKERDEESGLSDHGARYYAPWIGRWTAVDPLLVEPRPQERDEDDADDDGPRYKPLAPRELNAYAFTFCNPVVHTDPDGRAPIEITVYVIRATIDGQPHTYTGSTTRALVQRLFKDKHKWGALIRSKTTTIEAYTVTAEPNPLPGQTMASAKKEAGSAAEQVIKKRRAPEGKSLNAIEAAEEANIAKWGDRHNVRIGPRRIFRTGAKVGAFAGFALIDIFLMWRDQKVSRYVTAPYVLADEHGVFTLNRVDRGIFRSDHYYKTYHTGALKDQKVQIDEAEFTQHLSDARALWGYVDFWGDFVPGILRPELPEASFCEANPDRCA